MIAKLAGLAIYPSMKPWIAAAAFPLAGAINFSETINLGGILVGLLVLVFGMVFTVRSKVAQVWREDAEGWKERCRQVERERDEQRELKHSALTENAALRLKTDQTVVLERMSKDQRELIERLDDNQTRGLEQAAALLGATETRLVEQIAVLTRGQADLTRAQADLAIVVDRVVERLDKLDGRRD